MLRLKKVWFPIVVMSLLLMFCLGTPMFVGAQDTPTEEPTAVITDTPVETPAPATDVLPPNTETPQDILGIIYASLLGGSVTIAGSLFVTAIVGVLKMLIPESVISAVNLKNVVSIAVWILYSLAIQFGLGTQFQGIAAYLTPILVTVAPLIGVLIGSHGLYGLAKSASIPILGYRRP